MRMELNCYVRLSLAVAVLATSHEAGYAASGWMVLARSVEDRAIEYRQFGEGKTEVLVVGPLEGDETAALALVEQLADYLGRFPRTTSGVRVTIVRDPNPDGRLRRSPFNARGVRLNRNFATRNWHKLPSGSNWLSGREPESEAETRAITDLVSDLRPDRVILLATARRGAALVYAGPAESLVREFAKSSDLRPVPFNSAAEPGSLAAYTGEDRKLPTLVLRVPATARGDQLWSAYKRGLLAAIGAEKPASDSVAVAPAAKPARELPRATATLAANKEPSAPRPAAVKPQGVLKAEELEFGGELVPIVRPAAPVATVPLATVKRPASPPAHARLRRQFGPGMLSGSAPAGPLFAQPSAGAAANPRRTKPGIAATFPAAPLFGANSNSVNRSPSAAAYKPVPVMPPNRVERLPPVDAASAAKQTLPQPIPFYPETGS